MTAIPIQGTLFGAPPPRARVVEVEPSEAAARWAIANNQSWTQAAKRFQISRTSIVLAAGRLGIAANRSRKGRTPVAALAVGTVHGCLRVVEQIGAQYRTVCTGCGKDRVFYGSQITSTPRASCSISCTLRGVGRRTLHRRISSQLGACGRFGGEMYFADSAESVSCEDCIAGRVDSRRLARHMLHAVSMRGWPCTLTIEDILTKRIGVACAYCQGSIPPTVPGLDRMDSERGYHADNVTACCPMCNEAKSDKFTHEEFMVIMQARVAKLGPGRCWDVLIARRAEHQRAAQKHLRRRAGSSIAAAASKGLEIIDVGAR